MKKFYIETFGCQMNVHDSEKVIGTLLSRGYTQTDSPAEADLLLYNTCSIRDKAEQKVFHRLDQFKREHKGKTFGVLGCVAQQEGTKIFERARMWIWYAVRRAITNFQSCWCSLSRVHGRWPDSIWTRTKRSRRR